MPASSEKRLTLFFQIVRNIEAFVPRVRFVFAPASPTIARGCTWDKAARLLRRESSGINSPPPPRTVQAPLRAYSATQHRLLAKAPRTAGVERDSRGDGAPLPSSKLDSVLAHRRRTFVSHKSLALRWYSTVSAQTSPPRRDSVRWTFRCARELITIAWTAIVMKNLPQFIVR